MSNNQNEFEDYMTARNDIVDNAVYNLILTITGKTETELPWDMNIICDVIDPIEEILYRKGIYMCRPSYIIGPEDYDEEHTCYKDHGHDCLYEKCPYKTTTERSN